jgi:hypothetical protein
LTARTPITHVILYPTHSLRALFTHRYDEWFPYSSIVEPDDTGIELMDGINALIEYDKIKVG